MKAWYGKNATAENNWGYDWLPKLDIPGYDVLKVFDMMYQGQVNGYFCQGFNPIASFPNKAKVSAALAKLKYLVIMDPLATETRSSGATPVSTTTSTPPASRPRCSACRPPASPRRTARW